MHRSRGASGSSGAVGIFSGVRFVIFGSHSVSEAQYRSVLVRGGAVDAGGYDGSCNHVIVRGRVYDDPVCVAARNDGKVLVNEFWIEDSLDSGVMADATRILYRPVKDLNGIPGSKSLHMCLTGYQRQQRDDVMKMVALMGSKFSKPLIANQVTHLICYKFEGEKYELAKKVNIKLVNDRWLEDCLKSWEILPIENYTKSGWELEMEAVLKDSDEEKEDVIKSSSRRNSIGNSELRGGIHSGGSNLFIPSVGGDLRPRKDTVATTDSYSGSPLTNRTVLRAQCKDNATRSMLECNLISKIRHPNEGDINQESRDRSMRDFEMIDEDLSKLYNSDLKEASLSAEAVSASSAVDVKSSALKYSRKPPSESFSAELAVDAHYAPKGFSNENAKVFPDTSSGQKESRASDGSAKIPGLTTQIGRSNMEANRSPLPQKRKLSVSGGSSKSPKSECQSSVHSALQQHPSPNAGSTGTQARLPPPEKKDPMLPIGFSSENALKIVTDISQLDKRESRMSDDSTNLLGSTTRVGSRTALQHPSSNAESTEVEAPLSPENKDPVLMDANHLFDDDVPSNSVVKQATDSKNKSTGKKKSLSSGKLVTGKSSNALFYSNVYKQDVPSPKQAVGEQECRSGNMSKMAVVADPNISSSYSSFDFPSDNGLMQEENDLEIVSTTANQFGSLAIGKLTDKAFLNDRPEMLLVGPEEPKLAANTLNGEATSIDMQNFMIKEHIQIQKLQEGKVSPSLNDKAMATGNSSDAVNSNSFNEKNGRVTPSEHFKKAVAKMSFNSISKLTSSNGSKGKDALNSDRTPMSAGVMSGKVDNMALQESKKLNRNLKDGSVKSLSGDEVMKDGVETVECCTKVDMTMNCKETISTDSEKENVPKEADRFHSNCSSSHRNNSVNRDDPKLIKSPLNSVKKERTKIKKFNLGPATFILSGPRPQRKEFQAIIKQLRGKICRDSHQWSYQATHFIVPEPVRRTEKFFAAAAAGRWILKTDYLTAIKESGKFLDEQPFEWNGKGLTEDGAISLEAPRKWRLLRERTGHGAFYGMRIIIYGECIAPTLDTLKRVVKAGDGIILATSPPYTRFLKSGVDYAIVSPSMPRVDSWVQAFQKHEIPCVAADYLVEYVCKPGHSLETHVLYKTHAWAEKSLANILSHSEEIREEESCSASNAEENNDDLSCAVCGSRHRGEVMLICGDEAGSAGCGIGTHIDCCDPPLESVPEEDWFCPKCCCSTSNKDAATALKNTKHRSSSKTSILKKRSSSKAL